MQSINREAEDPKIAFFTVSWASISLSETMLAGGYVSISTYPS